MQVSGNRISSYLNLKAQKQIAKKEPEKKEPEVKKPDVKPQSDYIIIDVDKDGNESRVAHIHVDDGSDDLYYNYYYVNSGVLYSELQPGKSGFANTPKK